MRVQRIDGYAPEDLAALLSSWARSPDDLAAHARALHERQLLPRPIVRGPTDGRAAGRAQLLEAYGHGSNAEHAVVHLALENISLLAARAVLDSRLGSFTEKSGRFRSLGDADVPVPRELSDPNSTGAHAVYAAFVEQVDRLAAARRTFQRPLEQQIERAHPRLAGETEEDARERQKTAARRLLRHLVPLGALSSLCVTLNARSLGGMLTKLASAEEAEQRALADAIRAAVQPALPSLIEFAGPSAYRIDTRQALASWTEELLGATRSPTAESNGAVLVRTPDHVEERLVAAILYRHADHGYRAVRTRVAGLDQDTRQAVVDDYLRRRGRHDEPLRELEHVQYTFEVTLDGGALREVVRHRLTSRTAQPITVRHGYLVEPEIVDAGLEEGWRAVLDDATETIEQIAATHPVAARALVPLGFRQRVLITWNLRGLHYFVQLRSRRNGNRSVRHIAQDVYRQVERAHPLVARSMRVDLDDEGSAQTR